VENYLSNKLVVENVAQYLKCLENYLDITIQLIL